MSHSLLARRLRLLTLLTVCLGCMLVLGLIFRPPAEEPVPALEPAAAEAPLPLSGLRILVDPGHGGYDGGARARDSGTWEKHINLAVALEVEKALTAQGAAVTLTRREDDDLCDDAPVGITKKRQDMERRVAMGEEMPADLVLSIHMNEYRSRREQGPQVFYQRGAEEGKVLAETLTKAEYEENLVGVLGMLADKDYKDMLSDLAPCFAKVFTVTPDCPRALSAEDLQKEARFHLDAEAAASVPEALRKALDYCEENNLAGVVVCGSLYLAAEARPLMLKEAEN